MPNDEGPAASDWSLPPSSLVIGYWSFFRHSCFGIRHSPSHSPSHSPRHSSFSESFEREEAAGDLAVVERRLGRRGQADLARQARVAGEHKRPPPLTARAEHLAQRAIKTSQLLFLADALAVGRVTDQHSRRA